MFSLDNSHVGTVIWVFFGLKNNVRLLCVFEVENLESAMKGGIRDKDQMRKKT